MNKILKKSIQILLPILFFTLFGVGIVQADRTFSLPNQTGHSGQFLQTNGTNPLWANAGGGGGVNSVTGVSPIVSSGGANPAIGISIPNHQVLFGNGPSVLSNPNFIYDQNNGIFSAAIDPLTVYPSQPFPAVHMKGFSMVGNFQGGGTAYSLGELNTTAANSVSGGNIFIPVSHVYSFGEFDQNTPNHTLGLSVGFGGVGTGDVLLGAFLRGNNTNLIVKDSTSQYILNKLGGFGTGCVGVDNTGTLSFTTCGGTPTGTPNGVAFFNGAGNLASGTENFTYIPNTSLQAGIFGVPATAQYTQDDTGFILQLDNIATANTFKTLIQTTNTSVTSLFQNITSGTISNSVISDLAYNVNLGTPNALHLDGTTHITRFGYNTGSTTDATFIGDTAGVGSVGTLNTAVGYQSGLSNTGSRLAALGMVAGQGNTGQRFTAVGYQAGFNNSGDDNVMVGANAGFNNSGGTSTGIGSSALNGATAVRASALGVSAGFTNHGTDAEAIGFQAGLGNTFNNVVQLGSNSLATANNQFVVGSIATPISNWVMNGVNYALPSADGSPGQVWTTNGSGTVSWTTPTIGITYGSAVGGGSPYQNLFISATGTLTSGFLQSDGTGVASINYSTRRLFDSTGVKTLDWNANGGTGYDSFGNATIEWGLGGMFDPAGNSSVDWFGRTLFDASANPSIDYGSRQLRDSSNFVSVFWNARTLADTTGTAILNYSTPGALAIPYLGGSGNQVVIASNTGVLSKGGAAPIGTTYTPTLTNVTNVTASGALNSQYTRVGNVVTVYGSLTVTTTLAVATEVDISLPIASALATANDLNGVGQATSAIATNAYADGDSVNDRARLKFIGLSIGGAGTIYYSFSYTVI